MGGCPACAPCGGGGTGRAPGRAASLGLTAPHPTDRRAKRLVLTGEGTALRERLLALLSENGLLAGLTPHEQRVLQGLLERAIVSG
ncbi:hypothetical protein ABZ934_23060 [Streptomyces sp. NPDC046557]|uniref:hypothetical protein n=1 Tax=Streptomyces sp. NPDC046557 TaxID=3155372 RepID=UPI0033D3E2A2